MILKHNKAIFHSLFQSVPKYFVSDFETLKLILQALKVSMKKPTPATQFAQQKLISQMIQSSKSDEKLNLLASHFINLRHQRWSCSQSLQILAAWIVQQKKRFTLMNKIGLTCFMVEQRKNHIFHLFERQFIQEPLTSISNRQKEIIELLYAYTKSIVDQKLVLKGTVSQKKFDMINPKWEKQINLFNKAIGKFDSPIIERKIYTKTRSNLQIEVEALLHTLGCKYRRQVPYSGFKIDFQVSFPNSEKEDRKIILQVMGWPHYTCQNKVFGKDIFRCLVLNQVVPVRIVHSQQINTVKGTQNRLEFIQNIIEDEDKSENGINFQTKVNQQGIKNMEQQKVMNKSLVKK